MTQISILLRSPVASTAIEGRWVTGEAKATSTSTRRGCASELGWKSQRAQGYSCQDTYISSMFPLSTSPIHRQGNAWVLYGRPLPSHCRFFPLNLVGYKRGISLRAIGVTLLGLLLGKPSSSETCNLWMQRQGAAKKVEQPLILWDWRKQEIVAALINSLQMQVPTQSLCVHRLMRWRGRRMWENNLGERVVSIKDQHMCIFIWV